MLIACLAFATCSAIIRGTEDSAAPSSWETPAAPPAKAPKPSNRVTLANFNKIETGMSHAEVAAIFGSQGEVLSQWEMVGIETKTYVWTTPSGCGRAYVTFVDDEAQNRTQSGLK